MADPTEATTSDPRPLKGARRVGRPTISLTRLDVQLAAAEIIAKKGYHATTIRDIAEALDVRKATIHYHIGSKADLLFSVIESLQLPGKRIIDEVRKSDGDLPTRVRLFVRLTLERISADPIVSQVLVHEFRSLEGAYLERATEIRDEYSAFLVSLIEEGQAGGSFNSALDPHVCAISILLMLNSLNEWYEPKGRLRLDEVIEAQVTLVLSGLAKPLDP